MGWYQDGVGWGSYGVWGMGVMVVVWAGVLGVLVWGIVRLTSGPRHTGHAVESPRAVLDRRLAAGDIDAEQYAQMRAVLATDACRQP